jgi:cytoskeleton protein RodZ
MELPEAREIPPEMAGALLRAARESAGMTIDAVAQHLKLAPRQVKAIEDGDYEGLPGRTFIRGFVRNYARLVHLDPEQVLSALPGAASAPALEVPTLSPTAPTIGELPTTEHSRTPWTRWAIPSVLAAIVGVAALYEWMRPPAERDLAGAAGETHPTAPTELSSHTAAAHENAPSAAPGVALPNPVASSAPGGEGAPAPAPDASGTAEPARAASGAATSPGAEASAPRGAAIPHAAAAAGAAQPPASTGATPIARQTIVVEFRDSSWTEIRDRDGHVLLTGTNRGGTAQTVTGTPPFTLRIGNAADVTLRYKGERVDLAPYTQRNVARLTLQ